MIDFFLEVVILIFFRVPGAFVIWALTGFKKPFKDILEKDSYFLGMIGLITSTLIAILISRFL